MKCPNPQCNNSAVQPGDRFCGVCGHAIRPPAAPPPPPRRAPSSAPLPQPIPTVEVHFITAVNGGVAEASVQLADASGRSEERVIKVQIPPNTPEGTLLTLKTPDGHAMRISVLLQKHPFWSHDRPGAERSDLFGVIPVSAVQGRDGSTLEVPVIGINGVDFVRVQVPPNSSAGTTVRLAGMGLPRTPQQRGDLYLSLIVSDAAAQHYARWRMLALELLAKYGTTPAEQCLKEGWTPDEWLAKSSPDSHHFDNAVAREISDSFFGPKK